MKDSPLKITRWFLSFLTNTENHRAGNCRLWLTSKGWHEQSVQFTRSPSWQRDKQISHLQVQWRFCCHLKLFSSSFLLSVQFEQNNEHDTIFLRWLLCAACQFQDSQWLAMTFSGHLMTTSNSCLVAFQLRSSSSSISPCYGCRPCQWRLSNNCLRTHANFHTWIYGLEPQHA